jgi:hypothetical protein
MESVDAAKKALQDALGTGTADVGPTDAAEAGAPPQPASGFRGNPTDLPALIAANSRRSPSFGVLTRGLPPRVRR